MRLTPAGLVAIALLALPEHVHAQSLRDSMLRFPAASAMAQLARDFRGARVPKAADLVGTWLTARHVATEQFVTGRSGPDRVENDGATLRFRIAADNKLQALHSSIGYWISSNRSAAGDLLVQFDDSSDHGNVLTCRLATHTRLVCFDLEHVGNGAGYAVELSRMVRPPGI